MTHERVKQIIDAYGASPDRWPASERAEAQALLARDAGLQAYAREASEVDALLATAQRAPAPAWLAGEILSAAPQPVGARLRGMVEMIWPRGGMWQPAGALAASLAVGLWVGASGLAPAQLTGTSETTTASLTDDEITAALYGGEFAAEDWGYDG